MKITAEGQITIPQEFQEKFGFLPNTEVELVPADGALKLIKPDLEAKIPKPMRGQVLVDHMRGRGAGKLSTDQIMQLTRGEG